MLFDNLNLRIEAGQLIAIFGLPKSGKTTLLRLLCGTDHPDQGTSDRGSSVSWPLPSNDFLVSFSTVATNIRFMMRLYGIDDENLLREIAALVEISEFLNKKLNVCPRHVRARLAFALGVGLGFDICLFDERVSAVDKDFKQRAIEIVRSLSPRKAVVVATSSPKEVAGLCQTGYVLEEGRLTPFENIEGAIKHFKALLAKNEDNAPEETETGPELLEDEFALEVGV